MKRTFVSVLIGTYNRECSIEQVIVRVLEQDFRAAECEIIVVDDRSTDRTQEIVKKFEPRVRLLCKRNGGQLPRLMWEFRNARARLWRSWTATTSGFPIG